MHFKLMSRSPFDVMSTAIWPLAVTVLVTATSCTALGMVAASFGLRSRRHAALDIA